MIFIFKYSPYLLKFVITPVRPDNFSIYTLYDITHKYVLLIETS